MGDVIADGFGSEWERCARKDCDLQVVRPGMVQCIGDSDSIGCPDVLDVYVTGLQAQIERLRTAGDALADMVPVFDPDAEPTCLTAWREVRRER